MVLSVADYLEREGVKAYEDSELEKILKQKLGEKGFQKLLAIAASTDGHNLDVGYRYYSSQGIMPETHSLNFEEFLEEMPLTISHLPAAGALLDMGCIDGLKTVYYKLARPNLEITAIDQHDFFISAAKERAEKYSVEIDFQIGDFLKYSPGRKFDAVTATKVFHEQHVSTMRGCETLYHKSLEKCAELLKQGGTLMFSLAIREDREEVFLEELRDYSKKNFANFPDKPLKIQDASYFVLKRT